MIVCIHVFCINNNYWNILVHCVANDTIAMNLLLKVNSNNFDMKATVM